jgi:hypothetical protein
VLPPALRSQISTRWSTGVADACAAAGRRSSAATSRESPGPLVVDITAMGAAKRRRILRRAGGRAGDAL